MGKTCQICGKGSGMYPLCIEHLNMKNEGKVIKNESTGKWVLLEEETRKKTDKIESKCIVCGNSTKEGWRYLCSDCYMTTLDYIKELDKNMSVTGFRDYYYNLKQNIYRMTGFDKFIKPNSLKLIAIAKANDRYNYNKELLNKVEEDVIEIINKKKDKDFIKEEKKVIEHNEKVQKREFRSQDGHFLDSQIEVIIDDMLFNMDIVHAIHFPVMKITERAVNCDWYIPLTKTDGIYIELWGMDKKDYVDNKEEKIALYKKYNLKLISFDKSELNDTLNLTRDIMQKIQYYKENQK